MPTTVDKIRRALEKRDGIAEDEMRPLAEAYRTKVQEVNQRLDDAVMLLRKGLRSEAIQRVEMTPNALDAAADLEFPEWDEWNEILQFMGIPLPPKLNQDYVAQINEAIIESLPLDALLRRHRRLAIAKAPLGIRLRTLRQIARVDPSSSVWQDDVETWEKARLGQIDGELKQALENEDAQYLYQLHKELTGEGWRIAPSSRLIEQAAFAAEAHVRKNLETELDQLAPRINAAFEQRDESTARAIRSQWQSVRARFSVSVPAHLEMAVAPAMQWLEDLDRQAVMESERQAAMANLQTTLESESSIEVVQRAYDQASKFGEPMPQELADRVQELADQPAKQAKRKVILIGAGVGAVLLAAIIGVSIFLSSTGKANAQQKTIQQMSQFVSAGQYDEAISFFNQILTTEPDVASLSEMVALKATAQEAVDAKSERQELFDRKIAQASNDDPSLIDESLLPQLDELAATPGEQARVDDLRKRKAGYIAGETLRQSDEMNAKVAEYQRQFSELLSRSSSSTNLSAIEQLLSVVVRLPSQFPLRSSDAESKQETLRSRISSELQRLRAESMAAVQRQEAIDELRNSRSLEVYADRLREFSSRTIERTQFIDFLTVIGEEKHWSNVDVANAWLADLESKLSSGVTSSEAASLMESSEKLKATVSPNPILQAMPQFEESMKEIIGRRVILEGAFARIAKHPLATLVTLPIPDPESTSGTMNYLMTKTFVEQNAERMGRSGSIGVSVVSDPLGGVRQRAFQGPLPETIDEPMQSVQLVLGQKSKQAVDFDQRWEQTFIKEISDVMKRPDLDGAIKEWLVFQLLDTATKGSNRFRLKVPRSLQTLTRRSEVREKWYEPRPRDSEINPVVYQVVSSELKVAYQRFASPFADYEKVAATRLKWIGFLARSTGGQIEYHLRPGPPDSNQGLEDGTIYVAAPSRDGDAQTSFLPVGKLQQGHLQLTPNPVYQVPGRPLFLFSN